MGTLETALLVVAAAGCAAFKGSDVLDQVPFIDGHNNLVSNIDNLEKSRVNNFDFHLDRQKNPKWNRHKCHYCRTDLPSLRKGKVAAQLWTMYTSCKTQYKDSMQLTVDQIDIMKRLLAKYPNDLQLVTTADGIEEAYKAGKIASLLGMECGHSIDSRLSAVRHFYKSGVRAMSLTSTCSTPWSHCGNSKEGLTEFGRLVVLEMNRLGIMVDLSHASKHTMREAIETSRAPVILSYTNAYALRTIQFNIRDEILEMLPKNDGIAMVGFYGNRLRPSSQQATIEDVVAHINHIRNKSGVDHVGIGSGFDGYGKNTTGLDDVSSFPVLFDRLADSKEGEPKWSEEDLKKLASANFLRVFRKVEEVAKSLRREAVHEDRLHKITDLAHKCRTVDL